MSLWVEQEKGVGVVMKLLEQLFRVSVVTDHLNFTINDLILGLDHGLDI